MSDYQVEDVPASTVRKKSKYKWPQQKYPFDELRVGQSFFVPEKDCNRHSMTSLASMTGKRKKKKFTTHYDKEMQGTRIFRIA